MLLTPELFSLLVLGLMENVVSGIGNEKSAHLDLQLPNFWYDCVDDVVIYRQVVSNAAAWGKLASIAAGDS